MALIVMPSLLSKRPWARIRARCEASFFIVLSKSARCCSVRGHTYLTLIHLGSGFTYRIVLKLSRGILYQKTFGLALMLLSKRCEAAGLARLIASGRVEIQLRCHVLGEIDEDYYSEAWGGKLWRRSGYRGYKSTSSGY